MWISIGNVNILITRRRSKGGSCDSFEFSERDRNIFSLRSADKIFFKNVILEQKAWWEETYDVASAHPTLSSPSCCKRDPSVSTRYNTSRINDAKRGDITWLKLHLQPRHGNNESARLRGTETGNSLVKILQTEVTRWKIEQPRTRWR